MKKESQDIATVTYQIFVSEVVSLVQHRRVQAVQSDQVIGNQLYWNIGELIIKRQAEYGWGKSIVEQLCKDLTQKIEGGISWSSRSLWLMRQLVAEYSILNHPGSELEKLKQLISNVSWQHNI